MNVYRVEGLRVNGVPIQTHARGAVLDYVFVPVGDTETLGEAIRFYLAAERHLTEVTSINLNKAVKVGIEDPS